LFAEDVKSQIEDYDSTQKILAFFQSQNVDELIDRMLYTDLMTRMPDHLLVTVDRMSMAHSLEARSPLVDHKVVEYAAAIPGDTKLRRGQLKYILKKVAARYLPPELIERRSRVSGFRWRSGCEPNCATSFRTCSRDRASWNSGFSTGRT
jgi:asparagine synthase (glutamine-hydrolysing)